MTDNNVFLRFDNDADEEPSHEANIIREDGLYRAEWYHVDVGQVSHSGWFSTYACARYWLEKAGYQDFTS